MDTSRHRLAMSLAVCALAPPLFAGPGVAASAIPATMRAAPAFAHDAFQRTWARTDRPVSFGQVQRSWYWGPNPNTAGLIEDYAEGQGGKRLVQYFDKSRMEINDPNADQNNPFFVTNGLLTVELVSGKMQVGNHSYVSRTPANIPLASDTDDPSAPTYISFQGVSNTTLGDHPAVSRLGQNATDTINKAGQVANNPGMANLPGTQYAYYEATTKHNIPRVFWDFLNLTGPVYNSSTGQNGTARLSDPWFYTTGLPISEAYWAKVKIANQPNVDVLIQAFERRVLTYVPSLPGGFQVQMSNIGQHYYDWRYGSGGPGPQPTSTVPPGNPTPTPTSTVPPGNPTPTPTTPPPGGHAAAQFVGTWLNDDAGITSVGKLWIKQSGNNLEVKWFGVCTPGFCDNEQKTAAYTGEPFNITLNGRTFSLSLNSDASQLRVVYQGNQNLSFHRATASDYVGTWLNDDAGATSVGKLWIKQSGNNLEVKWFGVCTPYFCDNEQKTVAYNDEPFDITLDGRSFRITLDTVAGNKLKVVYQGDTQLRFHRASAGDYNGIWVNIDPHTNDIVRFEISSSGNTVNVHWFGACSPTPCDNGVVSGQYNGEPLVINTDRTFTITFGNAGGTRLRVDVSNAVGGNRTNILQKQP